MPCVVCAYNRWSLVRSAQLNGMDPHAYLKDVLQRLPTQRDSAIGELLPHRWISADYSLPSWEGQVQTELPAKDEGEEQQAQER
jgi:hypothetical protein